MADVPVVPPVAPAAPAAPALTLETLAAQIAELGSKFENKFTDATSRIGKLNEKISRPAEDVKPAAEPAKGSAGADFLAAVHLGSLRTKLSEAAQKKFDAKLAAGATPAAVKEWAEDLIELIPAPAPAPADGAKPPALPTGTAATAPSTAPATQWTQMSLGKLLLDDPAKGAIELQRLAQAGQSLFSLPQS